MRQLPRIVLGVTGGIAAYKAPFLARILRKGGAEVRAVLTPHARAFVGPEALRTVTDSPVFVDLDYRDPTGLYPGTLDHIRLGEWATHLLIAPATANTIAKLAHGIADNLLTTLALSFRGGRLVIAPAMNSGMWEHPSTVDNVETLRGRGARVLPVGEGELACGTEGPGRMIDIEEIAAFMLAPDAPRLFAGTKVLIASGPTEEPLDPVRVLTNRSSGKMGAALAREALAMGARVTVVSGPAPVAPPAGATVVRVGTALQMQQALEREFGDADLCIMAAAIADFRPAKPADRKIRRVDGPVTLELTPNPDITAALGAGKTRQFLVGFALETDAGEDRARDKMARKKCDLMVLNQARTSIGGDTSQISIIAKDKPAEHLPVMDKSDAARELLTRIAAEMGLGRA